MWVAEAIWFELGPQPTEPAGARVDYFSFASRDPARSHSLRFWPALSDVPVKNNLDWPAANQISEQLALGRIELPMGRAQYVPDRR